MPGNEREESSEPKEVVERGDHSLYGIDVGATFLTGVVVPDAGLDSGAAARALEAEEGDGACVDSCDAVPFKTRSISTGTRVNRRYDSGFYYKVNDSDHGAEVLSQTLAHVDEGWLLTQARVFDWPEGWVLSRVVCDIHDFGIGMIVLHWRPSPTASPANGNYGSMVEDLAPPSCSIAQNLAHRIVDSLATTLGSNLVEPGSLLISEDGRRGASLPDPGDVLWLWNLLRISSAPAYQHAAVKGVASSVCPNGFEFLQHRDHSFAAAVHTSVVCSERGLEEDADYVSKAPRLLDAWWTLFWILDRELLALEARVASASPHGLRELRYRANHMAAISEELDLLRSRLDSILVAGGARDLAAWTALARAWDFPYRVSVVDRKMEIIEQLHQQLIEQVSDTRMQRTAIMIYVFTAFSVLSGVVEIAMYLAGDLQAVFGARLAVVAGAFGILTLAVWLSWRTQRVTRARVR